LYFLLSSGLRFLRRLFRDPPFQTCPAIDSLNRGGAQTDKPKFQAPITREALILAAAGSFAIRSVVLNCVLPTVN